ncbi:MAG: glycosyltransferase, partial [Synergistaceae bacterium]|nr:glycosyltransferase [Synergistaceae bacterium]
QDYENLEIVFVNDASADETLSIAGRVLGDSGRVHKIISHEKNLGVSTARNTGLASSRGGYVCFCDGDDILEKNFVSSLVEIAMKDDADISCCGCVDRFEDGKPDIFRPAGVGLTSPLDGETALFARMLRPIAPVLCSILFRKNIITKNNLRFQDGCVAFEDIEFELKAFCRAKKVSFIHDCLYVYVHGAKMGTVRDADTKAKRLRRYVHSSEAHYRAAEYLSRFAPSERTKKIADEILLPEAVIRKFTIAARMNDKAAFNELRRDENLRKILRLGLRNFFRKPEIFLKAFAVLFLPGLYFSMRKE